MLAKDPAGPLGTAFFRGPKNRGLAWLPNVPQHEQGEWVHALVVEWAHVDPQAFPGISDWENRAEWRTGNESRVATEIDSLLSEKEATLARFHEREAALRVRLEELRSEARLGARRLLTAQKEELVDEVAKALAELGFIVERMDERIEQGKPKREDLRLRVEGSDWEAIVEVRGYEKGGAKQEDLQRLQRFATLYVVEKKRAPDKLIYIVNGEFARPPNLRHEPFETAKDDVLVFAESAGLVVGTAALFQLRRAAAGDLGPDAARELLVREVGVLKFPPLAG